MLYRPCNHGIGRIRIPRRLKSGTYVCHSLQEIPKLSLRLVIIGLTYGDEGGVVY